MGASACRTGGRSTLLTARSEMRLGVYEKVARAGGFRPVQWASADCDETGSTYRVNGKHTATASRKRFDANLPRRVGSSALW